MASRRLKEWGIGDLLLPRIITALLLTLKKNRQQVIPAVKPTDRNPRPYSHPLMSWRYGSTQDLDHPREEEQERCLKITWFYPKSTALNWKLPWIGKIAFHIVEMGA